MGRIQVSLVWFRSISSRVQVIIGEPYVWLGSDQVIGYEQGLPSVVCSNLQWFYYRFHGASFYPENWKPNRNWRIFMLQIVGNNLMSVYSKRPVSFFSSPSPRFVTSLSVRCISCQPMSFTFLDRSVPSVLLSKIQYSVPHWTFTYMRSIVM